MASDASSPLPPIRVESPPGGWDRAGLRRALAEGPLAKAFHRVVKAPFGHTVPTLQALEAVVDASDLALQTGEALLGAVREDVARSGSFAVADPTVDQRLFVGAFALTVWCDRLAPRLAELAPVPEVRSDLEPQGLEELLAAPPREALPRVLTMAGRYMELRATSEAGAGAGSTVHEREAWLVATLHAFVLQLRGTLRRITHLGRLRPFAAAVQARGVEIERVGYDGFTARPPSDGPTDLRPIAVTDVVGNREYLEAGLRLARDVAAFDLQQGRSPKKLNPVLFGLGRPGCGKTITAHAIGNYFLQYCRDRGVPARFRVIRRTDWASAYQNASAAKLVEIFRHEVYGFPGVCGVYWADIDTAFASRESGELRNEEKQNLGAVFGVFDGTLLPKDGKWFMICDANFMQMDEATVSRIAQNPFTVKGPETAEDYVRLLREVLLREERDFVVADDAQWTAIGEALRVADLSGRAVESIAGNVRAAIQDFEYPNEYFRSDFASRARIVRESSRRIAASDVLARVEAYVSFQKEAEEREARQRFENEVDEMVRRLNAGRAAAARLPQEPT